MVHEENICIGSSGILFHVSKMKAAGRVHYAVLGLLLLLPTVTCQIHRVQQLNWKHQCPTSIAESINNFGVSLTNVLDNQDNYLISPLSIYTALSMVYAGAGGDTAKQMANALQLAPSGLNKTQLNKAFKNLMNVIKESNNEYKLLLANAIFLQQGFSVNQGYVNDVHTSYDAVLKMVDFLRNRSAVKDEINKFVSQNTNNKIDKFLKEPLDRMTVLALVNAIYFKGTWQTQFPPGATKDGIFYKNDGSTKNVKFMTLKNQRFRFFYDFSTDYKFLELPYEGGHISMLVAIPDTREKIPDLDMTSGVLCRINGSMRNWKMEKVIIPKFQLKYRKELVNALKQLGIRDLFGNSADLTGIGRQADLKVSTIIHEAVIDVNEEGTEAAAATGVFITRVSVSLNVFVANHPFLFYMVDNRNGLILFSGRVSDP